jgi:hypothetical protein
MKQTYQGSCHCGAVRFEADIDLEAGTGKCNCSICTKTRNWNVLIKPDDFRLLSGEDAVTDYQFGTMSGHHLFCSRCGVRSYERGYVEQIGGDYVSIKVASLDGVPDEVLAALPIKHGNGRDNAWWDEPAVTSHL